MTLTGTHLWIEVTTMKEQTNLPVATAAKLMGVSQQYIRVGLQQKILPFGTAVRVTGKRFTYYISPAKFKDFIN